MRKVSHRMFGTTQYPSEGGMTLLELLVAMGLFSILAFAGALQFGELVGSFNRNNARHDLEFDISRIRSEAGAEGTRVVLVVGATRTSYSIGFDRLPYASPPVIEVPLFRRNLPNDVTITGTQPLIFDSRGYVINEAGQLTNTVLTMSYQGRPYLTATVYPTGHVAFR